MGVSRVCLLLLVVELSLCSPAFSYSHRLWTRQNVDCSPQMTPVGLRQSFESNCTAGIGLDNATCDRAWMNFTQAFAGRDPATVIASDYDSYFQALPIEAGRSQNLFWSGVLELVGMVSCMCSNGTNVVSSTNTPSSAIFNGIGNVYWCGTTNNSLSDDGIDYTNPCPCSVTRAFWASFSVNFALSAQGTAFFLGYGEKKGGTFQASSFFSQYELPNLSPPRVTEVVVMVVTNGTKDSCGKGTVVTLQERIRERNLTFSCYDIFGNPTETSQVEMLSACASKIITPLQNGNIPAPDGCFAMRIGPGASGAGVTVPQTFVLIVSLMFVAATLGVINK